MNLKRITEELKNLHIHLNKDLDNEIEKAFDGLNTITVYKSPKPKTDPLDKMELIKRRRMELL